MKVTKQLKKARVELASSGGKARWAKYTQEQREALIKKMVERSVASRLRKKAEQESVQ